MTRTRAIVLAQGDQSRMRGELKMPKQLLKLRPGRDNLTILHRTLAMTLQYVDSVNDITVVCEEPIRREIAGRSEAITLEAPGNSSLKGLSRTLSYLDAVKNVFDNDNIVVLLGDVCYSWACMNELFLFGKGIAFVGTHDLSRNAGELWGISWTAEERFRVHGWIYLAMLQHPPKAVDDTYQCGQLRRVLWEADRELLATGPERWWFRACDDYTRDFDVPEDVKHLAATAAAACEDDGARSFSPW